VKFMKHLKGGASYKSLRTSVLVYRRQFLSSSSYSVVQEIVRALRK
jgi:hypothetical protein